MASQNVGSTFDGMRNTVAIAITSPKLDSRNISFQFTSAYLSDVSGWDSTRKSAKSCLYDVRAHARAQTGGVTEFTVRRSD